MQRGEVGCPTRGRLFQTRLGATFKTTVYFWTCHNVYCCFLDRLHEIELFVSGLKAALKVGGAQLARAHELVLCDGASALILLLGPWIMFWAHGLAGWMVLKRWSVSSKGHTMSRSHWLSCVRRDARTGEPTIGARV